MRLAGAGAAGRAAAALCGSMRLPPKSSLLSRTAAHQAALCADAAHGAAPRRQSREAACAVEQEARLRRQRLLLRCIRVAAHAGHAAVGQQAAGAAVHNRGRGEHQGRVSSQGGRGGRAVGVSARIQCIRRASLCHVAACARAREIGREGGSALCWVSKRALLRHLQSTTPASRLPATPGPTAWFSQKGWES